MTTQNKSRGIIVRSKIKAGPGSGAGGVWLNHNGIVVRTKVKAGPGGTSNGGVWLNHNVTVVREKT